MRRAYLKKHRPALYSPLLLAEKLLVESSSMPEDVELYSPLLLTEKLFPHLAEMDTTWHTQLETIETAMM